MRYVIKELSGDTDGKPFELWEEKREGFLRSINMRCLGRFATEAQAKAELARRVAFKPPTVRAVSEYNEHGEQIFHSW